MKDRIKEIRKLNKMNQSDFGSKIGVKGNTIGNYELGLRNPSDAVIFSICREFGINEEWLRYGTEPMKKSPKSVLASYLANIATGDDDFIQDLIEVYMELDQTSKNALKKIADNMAEKRQNREPK